MKKPSFSFIFSVALLLGLISLTEAQVLPYTNSLMLWLKADSIGGHNNGDPVALWNDSSTNGYNFANGSAGGQPTYISSGFGGKPILRFDGTSDFMTNTVGGFFGTFPGLTFFFVHKIDADPPGNNIQTGFNRLGNPPSLSHYPFSDGVIYDGTGSGTRYTTGNPTLPLTNAHVYSVVSAPTSWQSSLNGINFFTFNGANTVTPNPSTAAPMIGASDPFAGANARFFDGDIAEIIIYRSALTAGQRGDVYEYLVAKYAIPEPTSFVLVGIAGVLWLRTRRNGKRLSALRNIALFVAPLWFCCLPAADAQINTNGLRLWLRADAGITLNGSTVSSWTDQSGHGYNAAQATASLQPTYVTNALNGKPVLQFDGAGDSMTGGVTSISSPLTLIVVGYFGVLNPTFNDYDYMLQMGDGNNQNISISRTTADPIDAPITNTYYSLTHNVGLFGPRIPGQTWEVFSQVWSNAAPIHRLFLNGQAQTVTDTASGVNLNGNYMIGGTISGGYYLNGRVAEVILYEGALSGDARRQVEFYLGDKYGITVPEPNAAVLVAVAGLLRVWRRRDGRE